MRRDEASSLSERVHAVEVKARESSGESDEGTVDAGSAVSYEDVNLIARIKPESNLESIPASSRTIAWPIGCRAPVTTHMKPYYSFINDHYGH